MNKFDKAIRLGKRIAQSRGLTVESMRPNGGYLYVHMVRKNNSPYGWKQWGNSSTVRINRKGAYQEVIW